MGIEHDEKRSCDQGNHRYRRDREQYPVAETAEHQAFKSETEILTDSLQCRRPVST